MRKRWSIWILGMIVTAALVWAPVTADASKKGGKLRIASAKRYHAAQITDRDVVLFGRAPYSASGRTSAALNPDAQRFFVTPNPDLQFPQRVFVTPNPDLQYPQRIFVTPNPDLQYPQRSFVTPNPDLQYPQRVFVTPNPDLQYPQRSFVTPNPDLQDLP